ncbi:uncharacterized protein LOC113231556 [Hyposmocoma kahamanoa]|uniref:uncharacterized protein LOC113231556 n=1 Tax=Hyposmocoma kahamanoa TaxID=1477025 RepID=UPI000E6D6B5E|nr:uncharacterized protein LOC113231556 [Hyposmocoma kahamanoa]
MHTICIIVTMYTLIHATLEDDSKVWRIQMSIPKVLMNLAEITGLVDKTAARTLNSDVNHNTVTIEIKPPDFNQILGVLSGNGRSGRDEADVSETENRHRKKALIEPIRDHGAKYKHDGRREAPHFYVEVGPGSYKSEQPNESLRRSR